MTPASRRLGTFLVLSLALQFAMLLAGVGSAQAAVHGAVPNVALNSVTMVSTSTAFAAGASGTILKTINGGDTWASVGPATAEEFTGITFWDTTKGLAVTRQRTVYYTADGGETWATVWNGTNFGDTLKVANAIAMVPGVGSTDARIVGGSNDLATQRGEQIWGTSLATGGYWNGPLGPVGKFYYVDPPGDFTTPYNTGLGELRAIAFAPLTYGWAVGVDNYPPVHVSSVYRGADNGGTWTRQTLKSTDDLTGVSAASTSTVAITSSTGHIFHTTDGGSTWTTATTPPATLRLNGVSLVDTSDGWAVGSAGALWRTVNGGATWDATTSGTSQELMAVATTGLAGIAVGKSGTVLLTTDGTTWRAPAGPPDTTPPIITVTGVTAGATYYASVTPLISFSGETGAIDSTITLNGEPFVSGSLIPTNGPYALDVVASDAAHNVETTTVAFTVAIPAPSALVLTSSSKTLSTYGQSWTVAGTLKLAGLPLPGKTVELWTSSNGSSFVKSSQAASTTTNGFTFSVKPDMATYYQVRFTADADAGESHSTNVKITPVAYLSNPVAPKTMSHSKSSTVYGYLKPYHSAGSVRIYKWRKVPGNKWKAYGYTTAKLVKYSTYSKYTVSLKLTTKGSWRLRAYHSDTAHAANYSSGYDYVTVK